MATQFSSSSLLSEKDCTYVWHPFTQVKTAFPPIPIIKAKNSCLYAEDGKTYIDAISSWWVNLHGHGHPYIIQKIKSQLDELEHVIFADFTHQPAIELAERLIQLLPGNLSKVFYSDNGSTAVEIAIKMSLQYWSNQNRPKTTVVCFKNSYHGDTFGAMSVAGKNELNQPFWRYLFDVEIIDPPFAGQEKHSLNQLQRILDRNETACFIFEPLILGSGGMKIYSAKGLNDLVSYCKDKQVITIADEVMTGFGRTGTLFACEQIQENPDLICLSKGLTGGFLPLGVTVCSQQIFDAFLGDHLKQAFLHGHSYTANPLACCAALASLDLLLDHSCFVQRERIAKQHQLFCQQWRSHPKLKRCEHLGTILVLEYKGNQSSYFQPLRDKLYHFFLSKGVLLRPLGNVIYIMPPYCIQENELQFIYEQIQLNLEEET